jgi:type II secretory pathway pseudopilin PulG
LPSCFKKKAIAGMTLLGLLMWMIILSMLAVTAIDLALRRQSNLSRDRAILQIKQIYEAALLYRMSLKHKNWPTDLNKLVADKYLGKINQSNNHLTNPWGVQYSINHTLDLKQTYFIVVTHARNIANATQIASHLPHGEALTSGAIQNRLSINFPNAQGSTTTATIDIQKYTPKLQILAIEGRSTLSSTPPLPGSLAPGPWVFSYIPLPGANAYNAGDAHVLGFVKNDTCVVKPKTCPKGTTPKLYLVPTMAAGLSNIAPDLFGMSPASPGALISSDSTTKERTFLGHTYNLSEFLAYQVNEAPTGGTSGSCHNTLIPNPTTTSYCDSGEAAWRVCLLAKTEVGNVVYNRDFMNNPKSKHLLAFYRCE